MILNVKLRPNHLDKNTTDKLVIR